MHTLRSLQIDTFNNISWDFSSEYIFTSFHCGGDLIFDMRCDFTMGILRYKEDFIAKTFNDANMKRNCKELRSRHDLLKMLVCGQIKVIIFKGTVSNLISFERNIQSKTGKLQTLEKAYQKLIKPCNILLQC